MSLLLQVIQFNLAPALGAGLVAWAVVAAGMRVLGIEHGPLRLCLLAAPLVKSTLVFLGLGVVLPWPDVFWSWRAQAAGPEVMLPIAGIWTAVALLAHRITATKAHRELLAGTRPADVESPRLVASAARVLDRYARGGGLESVGCAPLRRTSIRIGPDRLASPMVLLGSAPAIILPRGLVDRLDDDELDGAVAHELAHLRLHGSVLCASRACRDLAIVNPMAALMAAQLEREEETACDDLAVRALRQPERYAQMLLESYRFASEQAGRVTRVLQGAAALVGLPRPLLSRRIERVLRESRRPAGLGRQYLAWGALWVIIVGVLFPS